MSTDPTALAREVLDLAHEDETVTVCTIPDRKAAALARAVLAVAALADEFDTEAEELHDFSGGMSDEAEWLEATATRIRAALNGDNK